MRYFIFNLGQRLTVAACELSVCAIAIGEPKSVLHRAIYGRNDGYGDYFLAVVILCSLLSIVDAIVTDLLPPSVTAPCIYSNRMRIHMLKAVLNMSVAYFIFDSAGMAAASLNFVLSISCVWVAIADTVEPYVQSEESKST